MGKRRKDAGEAGEPLEGEELEGEEEEQAEPPAPAPLGPEVEAEGGWKCFCGTWHPAEHVRCAACGRDKPAEKTW